MGNRLCSCGYGNLVGILFSAASAGEMVLKR